jgi:hypothetical protein
MPREGVGWGRASWHGPGSDRAARARQVLLVEPSSEDRVSEGLRWS